MKKWFVHCETEIGGTDSYELIEEETKEDAESHAFELSRDNFYSYDYEQFEQDCEDSGIEFIEGEYYSYSFEEYNPKKHNDFLLDSDLKEECVNSQKGDKNG